MAQLGFTFYPKDWWVSDTFFELTPIQRYIYLECLFLMYSNDGVMNMDKTIFERRLRLDIAIEDWQNVVSKFEIIDNEFTHISVNSRLKRQVANKENAKKGGAPKGNSNAKKQPNQPKKTTQNNPPLEREVEIEIEIENKREREEEKESNISLVANAPNNSNDFLDDTNSLNNSNSKKEKNSAQKEKEFGKAEFRTTLLELGVNTTHADDWIKVRTNKKASFTQTALTAIINECDKFNFPFDQAIKICAENSWQGFKYSWVQNLDNNVTRNNTTTRQSRVDSIDQLELAAETILRSASQNY